MGKEGVGVGGLSVPMERERFDARDGLLIPARIFLYSTPSTSLIPSSYLRLEEVFFGDRVVVFVGAGMSSVIFDALNA